MQQCGLQILTYNYGKINAEYIDLNDRFSKYFITPDYSLFSDSLYFREIEAVPSRVM